MLYSQIRNQLNRYYFEELPFIAEAIREKVFHTMDEYAENHPDKNAYQLKSKQYEVISENVQLCLFPELPFFFETGALVARSDGKYCRGAIHANGWLYLRNEHIFRDIDPYGYDLYMKQRNSGLYTQCGIYSDMMHQGLPLKKVFQVGLRGILEELCAAEKSCETQKESDFISCAVAGITTLCNLAKKFAELATKNGDTALAAIAERVPYNPPETVHEGLCTLAFIRKNLGTLEGMGFSSFGRVDVLLAPLYENDIKRGVSREKLLDLVTRFLLIWDCTMNRNDELKGAEFELENTLTLGGCDENGKPIYNGITELFLTARDNENILYPKMMLRFSENSPREYIEKISASLRSGKSFSLYANDTTIIPALIASGVEKKDAIDYAVGGCWDILIPNVCLHNGGEYFSLGSPFIWSIYDLKQNMENCQIYFESLENVGTFDELYARYLAGIRRIAAQKAIVQSRGAKVWDQVNPCGALSALMEPCIPNKKDITAGSGKYSSETAFFTLLPETVDSLLAIKYLCFEQEVCTVGDIFEQCRCDWNDEVLRQRVLHAPSYGDGSEYASAFVGKFIDDLYSLFEDLPTAYGGGIRLGSNYYTEIVGVRNWVPSLPSGRRRGDFLSQGLTPTREHKKTSLFDILDGLRYVDTNKLAANNAITLTLPAANLDAAKMVEFFKMVARSKVMSLQPNVVKREDLLAAQKDPEHYGHIIVRVCGFSAPFVLLPPIFQEEILTRTLSEV